MEASMSFTKWLELWGQSDHTNEAPQNLNLSSTSNQHHKLPLEESFLQWQGEQSGEEDNSNLLKLQYEDVVIEVQSSRDDDEENILVFHSFQVSLDVSKDQSIDVEQVLFLESFQKVYSRKRQSQEEAKEKAHAPIVPKMKISWHSQSKWVIMRAIMEEREERRAPDPMTPNIKIEKHIKKNIRKSKSSIMEEREEGRAPDPTTPNNKIAKHIRKRRKIKSSIIEERVTMEEKVTVNF
ncbi:unnamed protein product [Calypogeia fissa]